MTRIYIIRHAEAEGNLFRRIHGQYDTCVTCNGMRQIEALKTRFADERIDACFSSDLTRTRTTAQSIWVPKRLELQCDARFREVALGVWEDVPFGQLEMEQPEELRRFNHDPVNWHVEGGEDYRELSARFLAAMTEAAERYAGGTIAIFTHGCIIRAVQQHLFYQDEHAGKLSHCDNTGVSLLEYENGAYRMVYLNDNSHLPEEISTFRRQNWWRKNGSTADRNLWFRPLEIAADRYADYLQKLCEPSDEFAESMEAAVAAYKRSCSQPEEEQDTLFDVMLGGRVVGVLQSSPGLGAEQSVGAITFLYLIPEVRRQGLGIQIIGQAVSVCRSKGYRSLLLQIPSRNRGMLAFCRKYGQAEADHQPRLADDMICMEYNMDLSQHLVKPTT